jgi:hypothetical protein
MTCRKPRLKSHRQHYWLVFATVAGIVLLSLVGWAASKATQVGNKVMPDAAVDGGADLTSAKPDTVRIVIQTVPPRRARVRWGRKTLGVIPAPRPLVVVRPRDSGPLDLVIRASGYLPVHTRAYTFSDSRVVVKITPPEEKSKLFGYREEPVPSIDGGVPAEPLPSAPAVPAPVHVPFAPAPAGPTPAVPVPLAPAQ